MGIIKNAEIALADFTALMINETFDAIISSTYQQQDKIREMQQAVTLPIEEFVKLYITEQLINDEKLRLFGFSTVNPGVSAVHKGEQYTPAQKGIAEKPPIFDKCGVKIKKGDIGESEVGRFISDGASQKIEKSIALKLGKTMQDHIKDIGNAGVPRLLIESGHITAKLAMRLEEQPAGTSDLKQKMLVRPLSMKNQEILSIKANLSSEIEIKFRTVL